MGSRQPSLRERVAAALADESGRPATDDNWNDYLALADAALHVIAEPIWRSRDLVSGGSYTDNVRADVVAHIERAMQPDPYGPPPHQQAFEETVRITTPDGTVITQPWMVVAIVRTARDLWRLTPRGDDSDRVARGVPPLPEH